MRLAYQLTNNPQHLYALCEMQIKFKNELAKACIDELSTVAPADVIERLNIELMSKMKP